MSAANIYSCVGSLLLRCLKLACYRITLSEVGLKEQPFDCYVSCDWWDERSAVCGRTIGLLAGSTERWWNGLKTEWLGKR